MSARESEIALLNDNMTKQREGFKKLLREAREQRDELANALKNALECETGIVGLCTSCRAAATAALAKVRR